MWMKIYHIFSVVNSRWVISFFRDLLLKYQMSYLIIRFFPNLAVRNSIAFVMSYQNLYINLFIEDLLTVFLIGLMRNISIKYCLTTRKTFWWMKIRENLKTLLENIILSLVPRNQIMVDTPCVCQYGISRLLLNISHGLSHEWPHCVD